MVSRRTLDHLGHLDGAVVAAIHVIEPQGVLPQTALRIDNDMELYDTEIRINVRTLNIDSASFTQIEEQAGGDEAKRAFDAMMTMKKIDVATIEAARRG